MCDTRAIDQVLSDAVRAGEVPGVVATAGNADGAFYQGAFGRCSLSGDAGMRVDTVFRIASMTKAVTATAVMREIEQGRLGLDQPGEEVLPFLRETPVLDGFNANGEPILRPRKGAITPRNLLTHTAGFVYDTWNANMNRLAREHDVPAARTGRLKALSAPLGFDPGTRWEYGINIDIAGRMVDVLGSTNLEDYFHAHILGPIGMTDTSFKALPHLVPRLAGAHARDTAGRLSPITVSLPLENPEFIGGGGGLFSTAPDYLRFLRALLRGGELDGNRILKPETVALMGENHMGGLDMLPMGTANPQMSNPVDLFPDQPKKWGLSFMINTRDVPGGRSAGSLAWAGINNTYYWLDPKRGIAGVLMTQVLPFADPTVLRLLDRFERAVYATI